MSLLQKLSAKLAHFMNLVTTPVHRKDGIESQMIAGPLFIIVNHPSVHVTLYWIANSPLLSFRTENYFKLQLNDSAIICTAYLEFQAPKWWVRIPLHDSIGTSR